MRTKSLITIIIGRGIVRRSRKAVPVVPRKNKILKDLAELVATNTGVYERCKAVAEDPTRPPTERQQAAYVARDALEKARGYERLAERLRAGVIGRSDAEFRAMYR